MKKQTKWMIAGLIIIILIFVIGIVLKHYLPITESAVNNVIYAKPGAYAGSLK